MRTEDAAPNGAEVYFGLGFYKYVAPTALETARAKGSLFTELAYCFL